MSRWDVTCIQERARLRQAMDCDGGRLSWLGCIDGVLTPSTVLLVDIQDGRDLKASRGFGNLPHAGCHVLGDTEDGEIHGHSAEGLPGARPT